jgi:signal transduction histidine kinase
MPPGAWMVLLWCAAIAWTTFGALRLPGLPIIGRPLTARGSFSSTEWELVAPVAVMVVSAVLLRSRPLWALALLLASSLAAAAIPSPVAFVFLPVVPVGIAVSVIAATRAWQVSAGCAAAAVVVFCGRNAAAGRPVRVLSAATVTVWVVIALAVSLAWLIGYAIGQNRRYAKALHAHAVTAERLRIAREVHDMVAHSIGIIAIQAGAGSRVIDTQPAVAQEALSVIETTSRETLAGLQRMLGAWRADRGQEAGAPSPGTAPGLTDVGDLATTVLGAGVRVDVQWRGPRRQLPANVDESAFRIIQEAVTNVVRHACTSRCQVTIDQRDSELAIEVIDDGHGGTVNGTGYGIAGMRERAALLHGEFSAGPRPGGGFRVAARLPVPAPVR